MHNVPSGKIQAPPQYSGWITRRRLLDRLHRSAHLPLTLIVAPAGYGKTTLMAEFAAECPYPVGWASLHSVPGSTQPGRDPAGCPS